MNLAERGPSTGYDFLTKLRMPRSSTYDALNKMRDWGWLTTHEVEGWGDRLKKKEYSFTVRGMVTALSLMDTRDEVDAAAERWGSLIPLVLGKWDYLKDKVEGGKVHSRLKIATKAFLSPEFADFYSIYSFVDLYVSFPSVSAEISFTCLFYDLNVIVKESGWKEAIVGDPDIEDFIFKLIPCYTTPHDSWKEGLEKMLKAFKNHRT